MNNNFVIRWLRVVLPFYLLPAAVFLVWIFLAPNLTIDILRQVLLIIFAYGIFRSGIFYPAYHQDYLDWIISSPWNDKQPLPFGSIELKLQDAAILGFMTLTAYPAIGVTCLYVPFMFMLGYLLLQMLEFLHLKQWFDFFVQAFGMGLVTILFLTMSLWVPILLVAVLYVFATIGIRRYLSRLSSHETELFTSHISNKNSFLNPPQIDLNDEIGWPFSSLIPLPVPKRLSKILVICWGLLAGWIYFVAAFAFMQLIGVSAFDPVALDRLDFQTSQFMKYLPIGVTVSFLILKLFRSQLMLRVSPPTSFLGRVFRGHWIISGYDRFFAPEFVALICGTVIPLLLQLVPISPVLIGTISITVSTFVLLALQEHFNKWLLTSKCILKTPIVQKREN